MRIKNLLLMTAVFTLASCGTPQNDTAKGNNNGNQVTNDNEHNGKTDVPDEQLNGSTDSSASTDENHGANTDDDSDDGYLSKSGNGFLLQAASTEEAYLYTTSMNVAANEDDAPLAFPYDQLDLELYTEFGLPFPLKVGKYLVGATEAEKTFDQCSVCILYWPNTDKKGNYDGAFFATGGMVEVKSLASGNFKAVFTDLVFERVDEDDYSPLTEEQASYYRPEELTINVAKAVMNLTTYYNYDCDKILATPAAERTEREQIGLLRCQYEQIP